MNKTAIKPLLQPTSPLTNLLSSVKKGLLTLPVVLLPFFSSCIGNNTKPNTSAIPTYSLHDLSSNPDNQFCYKLKNKDVYNVATLMPGIVSDISVNYYIKKIVFVVDNKKYAYQYYEDDSGNACIETENSEWKDRYIFNKKDMDIIQRSQYDKIRNDCSETLYYIASVNNKTMATLNEISIFDNNNMKELLPILLVQKEMYNLDYRLQDDGSVNIYCNNYDKSMTYKIELCKKDNAIYGLLHKMNGNNPSENYIMQIKDESTGNTQRVCIRYEEVVLHADSPEGEYSYKKTGESTSHENVDANSKVRGVATGIALRPVTLGGGIGRVITDANIEKVFDTYNVGGNTMLIELGTDNNVYLNGKLIMTRKYQF